MQIDDVISQAQSTRAALGSQRAFFGDVQGKVKLLSDKFPIIRGLLGTFLKPCFVLILPPLKYHFSDLAANPFRFHQKKEIKRHSHPVCRHCCLYVVSHYLLVFKVTRDVS